MRSEYYSNQEMTFTRFEVPHMVRAALIEGLKPENDRNIAYSQLVKQFIEIDPRRIDRLHRLLQETRLTRDEWRELSDLLEDVHPRGDNNNWRNLNYNRLEGEGVIQTIGGNLDGLVTRIAQGELWHVLALEKPIADAGIDYKKHIPLGNKIRLDSQETIRAFAERRRMPLPPSYDGRMRADLLQLLRSFRYSLNEAIELALAQHQTKDGKYSVISFTNYTTGDEFRIFPIDLVEMVEHFMYFRTYRGSTAEFLLGDATQKYAGSKILIVPKRKPDDHFVFNQTTLEYLAEFQKGPLFFDPKWWLNFRAECSCVYSQERSLFNIERGETKRKVFVFDAHIGGALLTILTGQGTDARAYLPIPSREMLEFANYTRFNMYEVSEKQRNPIREEGINILLLHYMTTNSAGAFARPGPERVARYVLQPLHL